MRHNEVRWERMFPDALEAAFEACPMVYLPYGLCEPHGWHNAVGMDAIRAYECSCQAAQAHGGLVAPPFYWHCHEIGGYGSWGHSDRPKPKDLGNLCIVTQKRLWYQQGLLAMRV